jgi:hypothetical protein
MRYERFCLHQKLSGPFVKTKFIRERDPVCEVTPDFIDTLVCGDFEGIHCTRVLSTVFLLICLKTIVQCLNVFAEFLDSVVLCEGVHIPPPEVRFVAFVGRGVSVIPSSDIELCTPVEIFLCCIWMTVDTFGDISSPSWFTNLNKSAVDTLFRRRTIECSVKR